MEKDFITNFFIRFSKNTMPKKANGPGAPAPTGALGWHEPTQSRHKNSCDGRARPWGAGLAHAQPKHVGKICC